MKKMKDIEEQLHQLREKNTRSLEVRDKNLLREQLEEYMELKPARAGGAISSKNGGSRWTVMPISFFRSVAFGFLALFLIGGGVTYAAQEALPGSSLYPVKVGFNEKVLSLAAVSNEAEARLQTRLAERRLEEAGALAAQGTLSTQEGEKLKERFEKHSQASQSRLSTLEENKTQVVTRIQSEFEATLAAHEEFLSRLAQRQDEIPSGEEDRLARATSSASSSSSAKIATKASSSEPSEKSKAAQSQTANASSTAIGSTAKTSTNVAARVNSTLTATNTQATSSSKASGQARSGGQESTKQLLSWLRGEQKQVSKERQDSEQRMWQQVRAQVENLTADSEALAESELEKAERVFEENKADADDESRQQLQKTLETARETLETAREELDEQNYAESFKLLREVSRMSLKVQARIKTNLELDSYFEIDEQKKQVFGVSSSTPLEKSSGTSSESKTKNAEDTGSATTTTDAGSSKDEATQKPQTDKKTEKTDEGGVRASTSARGSTSESLEASSALQTASQGTLNIKEIF